MSITTFFELKEKLEIQKYAKPSDIDKQETVSFSGSPRKHPYEPSRVVLVADPFSAQTFFYEFNIEDIVLAEELPNISNLKGESTAMVRLWVKKRSVALRCTPFIVDALT